MRYAHGHIPELMREAVEFYLQHRGAEERKAVLDILGYPYEGYDDNHFSVCTLIILDKAKTILKEEKPWLGWKVSVGYKLTGSGHSVTARGGSRITATSNIDEEGLMDYLETGGNPLYRIELEPDNK